LTINFFLSRLRYTRDCLTRFNLSLEPKISLQVNTQSIPLRDPRPQTAKKRRRLSKAEMRQIMQCGLQQKNYPLICRQTTRRWAAWQRPLRPPPPIGKPPRSRSFKLPTSFINYHSVTGGRGWRGPCAGTDCSHFLQRLRAGY
jgi:hypothetical protein